MIDKADVKKHAIYWQTEAEYNARTATKSRLYRIKVKLKRNPIYAREDMIL